MEPVVIGVLVFGLMFAASLLGMRLRTALPEAHFTTDSKDTIKVAAGLIATMTALVLGLVTASAKGSFDAADAAVKHTAVDLLALDRTLARYGPESAEIRERLKQVLSERIEAIWPEHSLSTGGADDPDATGAEHLAHSIRELTPQSDEQRWLQARALDQAESLLQERWTVFGGVGTSVPVPFLAMLVFWLGITFASFGLFAPRNATVVAALLACTVCVAGAIFLILEMDDPFRGVLKISPEPMRYAYSRMNG
jgi:hypothetical protein